MRVLVVEDSKVLRRVVSGALKKSGYAVDATGDGAEGLWFAESNPYDVIVLDLMLPGLDGMSVLKQLRSKGAKTPVLILTAKNAVEDRVRGLQAGADDYVIKPFALDELLARVQVLCRRGYDAKDPVIRIGGLTLDSAAKTARCARQSLRMTAREFRILEYLAFRRGVVTSRQEIEAHIFDDKADTASNVVDSVICLLRQKMSAAGGGATIRTRRGLGYVLDADDT